MKKLIASLALLVAGQAAAQGLTPLAPGQKAKSTNTITTLLSLPFTSTGCKANNTDGVSISRNTTATVDIGGTITTCASDQYRVGDYGLYIEEASTNKLSNSAAFNLWAKYGSGGVSQPVATADQATAPDGSGTADKVDFYATTGTGQTSILYQSSGSAASGATLTFSVWARTVTGTGTVYVEIYDETDAVTYSVTSQACSLTTAWTRCSVTKTHPINYTYAYTNVGPDTRTGTGQPSSQSALSVYLWGAQAELKPSPTSYIACSSTPCSRSADVISVASGIDSAAKRTNWTLSGTFQKDTGKAWTSGTPWALDGDTTTDNNNDSRLTMDASNLVWTVKDGSGATGTVTYGWPGGTPWTAGSSHTVEVKAAGATRSMKCDGSSCGSSSGTTTTFSANPGTLYLGGKSSSEDFFNGFLKSIKITSP